MATPLRLSFATLLAAAALGGLPVRADELVAPTPASSSSPTPPVPTPTATTPPDAAPAAEPAPPSEAPTAPASTAAPAARKRLTRVVVQDVVVDVADVASKARLQGIFTAALVAEVRKLDGVSVVGLDEVRALLSHEADAQTAGCDEAGCLADIADALGADLVVTARLATVGESHVIALRRLDASNAKVTGVDRRFDAGNGEEFLAALGPAVAELFPDVGLRAGAVRGADKEAALRLNPPPVPVWAFASAASASAAALLAGGVAGGLSAYFQAGAQDQVERSRAVAVDAVDVKHNYDAATGSALVANVLYATGGVLALGTAALALVTDFGGYADAAP